MKKMTKWALPLSLLMMVGVSSGAIDASAKTVNNDATKQTSVSNNNWQYNKAYNWVKVNNNTKSPFQVKKMTKAELNQYLASLKGSNKGTATNKDSNKGTTTNADSNKGTTQNTASDKGTTTNDADSNKGTTQNTASDKGTTTNTDSNKGTTQNTTSDKGTSTNTGSNTSTTTNSNSSSVSQFEQQVITLTNAERAKEGLPALQADTTLMKSARAKSDDMAKNNYFSHTSPTYGSPFDQMKSFGISYKAAAENIAQGQKTPQEVVQAWMNSSGHRANIMNGSYTHIGVGYSANGNYWTQQFIQK
ncbi:CAP domain-containing protein [uncultured Rummeliibacillus sp.]|mgnify:CR=1 FL=1|uniref:CAP domain-containing protein n=1 Tax=uncultured Rummeliibacillus sp. TaxID=762292 RepID=UPI0026300EAB|nr:CAP domain-containing protein [uncultured Rummeliibacillus sp.]